MPLNPIPPSLDGDPDGIERFARSYAATAEALRDATSELRALASESVTISLAVDEVRSHAEDARGQTDKVATRYQGAADAYFAYRSRLASAQSRAEAARAAMMATNSGTAQYWVNRQSDLRSQAMFGGGSEELLHDLTEANRRVDELVAEYNSALGEYNAAVEDKRTAVAMAMAALDDAADAAGLNDSFWEAVAGAFQQLYELAQKYLAPLIEKLREVLELLKSIVDLISLIVTVIALFVPALAPLAAALTVISIALSAAILLCSVALFALGRESLGRVIGDTIGLVTSIVTSKVGGAGGAHVAQGASAVTPTFAQVAARNGGVINTVLDAALEVTVRTGKEVVVDLATEGASHLAETGLDIRVDAFPNPYASGGDGVLSGAGGAITWDLNTFADPEVHSEFLIDQGLGIMLDYLPGSSEVLNVVDQFGDVIDQPDWNLPSAVYGTVSAS